MLLGGGESRSIKIDQSALKTDILSWDLNNVRHNDTIRLTNSHVGEVFRKIFVLNSTQQYQYFYIRSNKVDIGQPFYITSTGIDIESTNSTEYIKCEITEDGTEDNIGEYTIYLEFIGDSAIYENVDLSISKSGLMNIISTIQLRIVKDA